MGINSLEMEENGVYLDSKNSWKLKQLWALQAKFYLTKKAALAAFFILD